jgi:hypothetical protein
MTFQELILPTIRQKVISTYLNKEEVETVDA